MATARQQRAAQQRRARRQQRRREQHRTRQRRINLVVSAVGVLVIVAVIVLFLTNT